MSDKPQSAGAGFFALPDHHVISLHGRDAVAFAQAQTMNDVAALADGQWQWNGWLTPKGRVIALFALLRLEAETLWLLLPDADPAVVAVQLQRFVFRSKLTITARRDLRVAGAFAAPSTASGAQIAAAAQGSVDLNDKQTGEQAGVELDASAEHAPRTLRIAAAQAAENAGAMAQWRSFDVAHGLPRLGPAQAEHWTPQQLSLDRLNAYSVKKGCYPGQEIVARTHFLGQAKRGLALLETAAPAVCGASVFHDASVLGQVVSIAAGTPALALAVLPTERDAGALTIGDEAAREQPLLTGLAR